MNEVSRTSKELTQRDLYKPENVVAFLRSIQNNSIAGKQYCRAADEIERLQSVAKLASELCDAVDEDAEDIGGHRPVHVILGELGPAVDKVMPR